MSGEARVNTMTLGLTRECRGCAVRKVHAVADPVFKTHKSWRRKMVDGSGTTRHWHRADCSRFPIEFARRPVTVRRPATRPRQFR